MSELGFEEPKTKQDSRRQNALSLQNILKIFTRLDMVTYETVLQGLGSPYKEKRED
jgi:hypothetical protein